MDVWKNTTLGNSNVTQKLVQFLIVADGELKVTRDDTGLLVVTSSVACQLKDFGSKVLKDGSEVNGSACRIYKYLYLNERRELLTSTNTLGIVTLAKEAVNTSNRERETGLRRTPASNKVSDYNEMASSND